MAPQASAAQPVLLGDGAEEVEEVVVLAVYADEPLLVTVVVVVTKVHQ